MDECNVCKKVLNVISSSSTNTDTLSYTQLRECIENIEDIIKNNIQLRESPKFYVFREKVITVVRVKRASNAFGRLKFTASVYFARNNKENTSVLIPHNIISNNISSYLAATVTALERCHEIGIIVPRKTRCVFI